MAGRRAAVAAPRPAPAGLAAMRAELLRWFDHAKRDLPWRRTKSPYAIWLSEVMLQQTQVATVIPYYERFLARFPTVEALAAAPLQDVLAGWRGLGYYSRARNLHRAAQQVVSAHGGSFPRTAAQLLELPGFGRYTAGAVASIAFGEAAPLVDGNVARVFSRLFLVEGAPGDTAREARLWALAAAWVQGERPGDFNQALMELGALVCRLDSPTCLLCPLRERCGALKEDRVGSLPPPRVRAPRTWLRYATAVWRRGDAVLFARREEKGLFGGLWELPSALVAEGAQAVDPEREQAALASIGVKTRARPLGSVQRALTHRDLELRLYAAEGRPPAKPPSGYCELTWATPAQAEGLGMSTAMQRALKAALAAA